MVSLSKEPRNGVMTTPVQPRSTLQFRLTNALHAARQTRRIAEYQGHSARLNADVYRVKSTDGARSYYLYAYTFRCTEGHEYPGAEGRTIKCECTAALNGQPCRHGARLALRLAREYKRSRSGDAGVPTGAEAAGRCIDCSCDLIPGADTCPVCGHPASAREESGRVTLESLFVA